MIFIVLMPPRAATWVLATTLLVISLALALRNKPTRTNAALAGLFAGFAVTVRLDTVALATIVSAPLSLLHLRKTNARWYVFGVLTGAAPFFVHTLVVGIPVIYDNMFVDPVIRTAPGRRLPLPPNSPDNFRRFVILVAWLSLSVLSLVVIRPWRRIRQTAPAVAIFIIFVCLLPYVLQRADRNHFAQGMAVFFPLALYVLLTVIPSKLRMIRLMITIATPALALVAMHDGLWGSSGAYVDQICAHSQTVEFVHEGRSMPIFRFELPAFQMLFKSIDDFPDAKRVYVAPSNLRFTPYSDLHLYFLMPELTPSGYYFEMNPGCTNRVGSRLPEDIQNADLLILGTQYNAWSEPNASTRPGSTAAEEVVARDFVLQTDAGIFRLYVKRGLKPSG